MMGIRSKKERDELAEQRKLIAIARYVKSEKLGRPLTAWEQYWVSFKVRTLYPLTDWGPPGG